MNKNEILHKFLVEYDGIVLQDIRFIQVLLCKQLKSKTIHVRKEKIFTDEKIYFTYTSSMMYMLFIDLECKNGLLDGNEKDRGDIQKNRYDRSSSLKINQHAHHLCYVTNFNSRRASILI